MPQSGKHWAQAVKALARHKDSVTRVTKCQHASCQMTQNQERTDGGGRTEGELEETQPEGRRRQDPRITASAGPASPLETHGRCSLKDSGTPKLFTPGLEAKRRWLEGTANSRRHREGLLPHILCPSSPPRVRDTLLVGFPTALPLGPELRWVMPAAWQVQAASSKTPVGWPQQSICLRGCYLPCASSVSSAPSRGLSTVLLGEF